MNLSLYKSFEIFEDNLPDIRKACLENAGAIIEENTPYEELDVDKPITVEAIRLHINYLEIENKAKPLFQTVRRIDSYRAVKDNPHSNSANFVTDIDMQNAREAPEEFFIQEANLSTRRPHTGLCFEHNDTKPSLTLIKSKETGNLYLKCWVCDKTWDSLALVMSHYNLNFIDAVRYINNI